MNLSQVLALIVCVVFLNSCALSVIFPGSLMQRPDVSGRLFGGDVSIGLTESVEVVVFDDITTTPPTRATENSTAFTVKTLFPVLPDVNYRLGLLPVIDLYYTGHFGLKYQFIGERKSLGPKLSAFAGVGSSKNTLKEVTCAGGLCEGEVIQSGYEYGLSGGYGITPLILAYITLGQQSGVAKSKVTQPSQIFEYKDRYTHALATLGMEFGESIYVNPEVSLIENVWTTDVGSARKTATSYGLHVGWKW